MNKTGLVILASTIVVGSVFVLGNSSKNPKPYIASITPDSGYIGTTITLTGSGFTPDGNILFFGPVESLASASSTDSKTVAFPLNSNISFLCSPRNRCEFRVKNANGTSNAVQFNLIDWLSPEDTIKVVMPNGGEKFKKGENIKISWTGPGPGTIFLVKPEATTEFDIASAGLIISSVNPSQQYDQYAIWQADVEPGEYKILLWASNPDGSMYIANGKGATTGPNVGSPGIYTEGIFRGNWDVSDQPFSVVAD